LAAARHFFPNLSYYASLHKMLEHEIDAVLVVTPAFKRATDAIAALNAGKHVLSVLQMASMGIHGTFCSLCSIIDR
jgi:predicted dehydrogenase